MYASGVAFSGSRLSWRTNRYFVSSIAVYSAAAILASECWNISVSMQIYSSVFLLSGFAVSVILFAIISIRTMLERPPRLYPALRDRLLANRLPERLLVGFPVALVLPIFFSLFTSMKGGISRVVPFYADRALIAGDRIIHGGVDAWKVFHPLLGFGLVTLMLNFMYNIWFMVMFTILFCVTFSIENERLRSQYLVSFVLLWFLLGNVVATLVSSVGPAFVVSFYDDKTFMPLMDYLRTTDRIFPVWALDAQEMLLANTKLDGPRLGSGISAFPSMHVAVATLNAIYLWRFGGLLRWASIMFLIAIQLAAVHLAWHYALDGYASILATPIIWALAGWISDLSGRRITASTRS